MLCWGGGGGGGIGGGEDADADDFTQKNRHIYNK